MAVTAKDDLKKAGLSATMPRRRILALLAEDPTRHLSAEDIYKRLADADENVSLGTVYRALQQFAAAGLISRVNLESGHAVYELHKGKHHDHMVCTECGKIEEFVDSVIEQHQRDVVRRRGWMMTDHTMVIYGLCRACQKQTK